MTRLIYAFDLDGTLCRTNGGDYENAEPIAERIELVNERYEAGHYIIIHTARGQAQTPRGFAATMKLTRRQLRDWNVQFNELRSKPYADVYVDDRAIAAAEFFEGIG